VEQTIFIFYSNSRLPNVIGDLGLEYVIGYTIMALNNCCEKASAVFRNRLTQTDIRDMSLAIMCFYVTDLLE